MALNFNGKETAKRGRPENDKVWWNLKLLRTNDEEGAGSDSESFEPEYHQIKKMGLKPNLTKIRCGGWSLYENDLYLRFILKNFRDFETEEGRRRNKVFHRLSKVLRRRTPSQCRSHHQKLQLKHDNNLLNLVEEIQSKIQRAAMKRLEIEHHHPPLLPEKVPSSIPEAVVVRKEWYVMEASCNRVRLTIESKVIQEW